MGLESKHRTMSKFNDPRPDEEPRPEPSRVEQARRIIEEYADDLREIIKRIGRRMN
jgi:hypothetical protein